jgi:threonine dehydratase
VIGDPANLAAARETLRGVAVHTDLVEAEGFAHPVRLKAEYQQPIGAFKIRGAWTALSRLDEVARARGVVTSSSGNHGYGIAWAAHRLGMRAAIVMPESAPKIKQDHIRAVGAEIHLVGAVRGPEQFTFAEALARDEGLTLIHPFDHPDVIAGQATCTIEILEDWPEVSTVVLPTGGGGLLAGACIAAAGSGRPLRLVGVEPEGIPKLSRALELGEAVDVGAGTSLADGILTRSLGRLTWPIIHGMPVEAIGVSDAEIRDALRWLAVRGIRAEPSGAASVAALVSGKLTLSGPTALVVSGGNVDPAVYAQLVN